MSLNYHFFLNLTLPGLGHHRSAGNFGLFFSKKRDDDKKTTLRIDFFSIKG